MLILAPPSEQIYVSYMQVYEAKESLQCYPALIAANKHLEIKLNLSTVAFFEIPVTT